MVFLIYVHFSTDLRSVMTLRLEFSSLVLLSCLEPDCVSLLLARSSIMVKGYLINKWCLESNSCGQRGEFILR